MKIVVTGASSGIGKSLYQHFTRSGHEVWGWARRAAEITGKSSRCDVANWESVAAAASEVEDAWGECDVLICAAGIQGAIGDSMQNDPAEWAHTVQVNLVGTYYSIRAMKPLLQKLGKRTKVICFSGGGATSPRPRFSAYACAKAGVVRLVENLAKEWEGQSIDINAVAPGAIATSMTDEVLRLGPSVVGEADFVAAQKTKAQAEGSMGKVLGLVDYLASSRSDGLSGKLLSAPWDEWELNEEQISFAMKSDVFTLRRITKQ